MKLIQNITLVADDSMAAELLGHVRLRVIPLLREAGGKSPQLAEVVPEKENCESGMPRSFSLQFEFDDEILLEQWRQEALFPLLHELRVKFGDNGLAFPTILKTLPIE